MKLHIYKNKEEMSEALASWMCEVIESTLKDQEYFTLVLSGGSTPQLLYKTLVSDKFKDKINWSRIHVFWGDERAVPYADERNNARMAHELLLNNVDIPANHVHIMRTDIEPNFSTDAYRKMLHDFFDNTSTTFDLVLLGMGDDGHTLSLFPGSTIIEEHKHWVNSVYIQEQEMYRITLMPKIVNRAAKIAFMVDGEKKAKMLQQVLQGEYKPSEFPSQIIKPENGELHWFVDEAAAQDLHSF
ncbi:MAG: 6-phosphogluconolactonase [Ginsengibacter sp.]|jgi:6-phosphogluconolactonase